VNFPILQLQELHRGRVFPDAYHPSKAPSNVFPEKRPVVIFAGLYMPVCRFIIAITSGRPDEWLRGRVAAGPFWMISCIFPNGA
jgi:hypothetical protein